jgi:hypothetical protein
MVSFVACEFVGECIRTGGREEGERKKEIKKKKQVEGIVGG